MVPSLTHYTLEELADGVQAAIHRPGGFGICNSGIVQLSQAGLVFDTGLSDPSARELFEVATRRLAAAPSLVVNSHWHLDHTLGNQNFRGVPIVSTGATREAILQMGADLARDLDPANLRATLEQLEGRRATMAPGHPLEDLEFNVLIHRALLSYAQRPKWLAPTQTFETRREMPGRRGAQLLSFGSGHTGADAVLFLSQERVLFTGDLVCLGIQPSLGSGDPEHWLVVLDRLEGLHPTQIVPGHGPVAGPDRIQETREYLEGVLEAARSPPGAKLPRTIRVWEGSVGLEENLAFARGWVARTHGGTSTTSP